MHAIQVADTGGPDVLELVELHRAEPGPGEVLIDVAAAGVNFVDTYVRSGLYSADTPLVLGREGAGTVVAVGDGVGDVALGDRVAWTGVDGSYASQVVARHEQVVTVPDDLELADAAASVLQGTTAHYLSHSTYHLGEEDTALVWAAAGGVGRLLVQLAKRRGATVIACTSTQDKAGDVAALGADHVILYRDVDVASEVRALTGGAGVDVVYDSVGAASFDASLGSLKTRGLLVSYGQSSGKVAPIDTLTLSRAGSLFLTRPMLNDYIATKSEFEWRAHAIFDLIAHGQLDLKIHQRYPLADAASAHRDLESGTTSGKLLLIP